MDFTCYLRCVPRPNGFEKRPFGLLWRNERLIENYFYHCFTANGMLHTKYMSLDRHPIELNIHNVTGLIQTIEFWVKHPEKIFILKERGETYGKVRAAREIFILYDMALELRNGGKVEYTYSRSA